MTGPKAPSKAAPRARHRTGKPRGTKGLAPPHTIRETLAGFEAAFRAGNVLAVVDTLEFCREMSLPLPDWLNATLTPLFIELHREAVNASGRRIHAGVDEVSKQLRRLVTRHRKLRIHYLRWDMFNEVRQRQEVVDREIRELRALQLDKRGKRALEDLLADQDRVGRTREDACAAVSDALAGSPARGSPAAVRRSHLKIQKIMTGQDPNTPPEALLSGSVDVLSLEAEAAAAAKGKGKTPRR